MDFELSDWTADRHVLDLDNQLFSSKNQLTVPTICKEGKKDRKRKQHLSSCEDEIPSKINRKESLDNDLSSKDKKIKLKNSKLENVTNRDQKVKNSEKNKRRKFENIQNKESTHSNIQRQESKRKDVKKLKRTKEKNDMKKVEKINTNKSSVTEKGDNNEKVLKKRRNKKKKKSSKKNKYKHLDEERARQKLNMNDKEISTLLTNGSSNILSQSEPVKKTTGTTDILSLSDSVKKKTIQQLDDKRVRDNSTKLHKVKHNDENVQKNSTKNQTKAKIENVILLKNSKADKKGQRNGMKMSSKLSDLQTDVSITKVQGSSISHEGNKKDIMGDKSGEKDTPPQRKKKKGNPLSLRERMLEQLASARFRYINEQLYTQTGSEAVMLFEEDEESFHCYHTGFQNQVEKWPTNPVNLIIKHIKKGPDSLVVGDFGCGDAKIARSVPNKVYSFDLVALNDHVTVCNIEKVPLKDRSLDIAVFCLSLMGTNLTDYLKEANRVLKKGGILMIAEVTSRIEKIGKFVRNIERMGYNVKNTDTSNSMFVLMDFKKTGTCGEKLPQIKLDPCVYKKR